VLKLDYGEVFEMEKLANHPVMQAIESTREALMNKFRSL
jgi:hypothetical protein